MLTTSARKPTIVFYDWDSPGSWDPSYTGTPKRKTATSSKSPMALTRPCSQTTSPYITHHGGSTQQGPQGFGHSPPHIRISQHWTCKEHCQQNHLVHCIKGINVRRIQCWLAVLQAHPVGSGYSLLAVETVLGKAHLCLIGPFEVLATGQDIWEIKPTRSSERHGEECQSPKYTSLKCY